MQVYFLAERECILSLGGMALGIVDGFERSVELDPEDGVLCTLAPLGGYLPVSFCIDEDFLIAPRPGSPSIIGTERGAPSMRAGSAAPTKA